MINFLLGAPGSGKSYEAVAFHIIPSLDQGRAVVTNLPLNVAEIEKIIPNVRQLLFIVEPTASNSRPFSTVADYQNSWRDAQTGQGALYVIDECHMALPRGSTSRPVEEWYAMHRHTGSDVLLITQSYRKISQTICDLIQTVYRVRKNIALGSSTSYIRKVQDGIRGEVVNTSIRKYNSTYFKYYKSHTLTNASVNEAQARDIKSIWSHWSIKGLFVLIVFAIWFASTREVSLFPQLDPNKPPLPSSLNQSPPASTPVHQIPTSQPLQQPKPLTNTSSNFDTKPQNQIAATVTHPYGALTLHIYGSISNNDKTTYLYLAAYNAQPSFTLTSEDLTKAGYTFNNINDCLVHLFYKDFNTYVTCDSPKVNANPSINRRSTSSSSPPLFDNPMTPNHATQNNAVYGSGYGLPPVPVVGYLGY